MGWNEAGDERIKRVHELAAEYAEKQGQPIDAEDARMLEEEAIMYACAIVFGQGITLEAFRKIEKVEDARTRHNS